MRFYWPIAKVDAEQRMVWGYASTEAVDDQGESITRAAMAAALDDYMRFANIREMHRPSAVGVAREAAVDDRGLYLGAKIVDGDAWTKVIEGVYKGFSIGGRVTGRDPADRRIITGLVLTEISVVDRPANPEAVFDCWKLSASETAVGDGATDYADPGYQADREPRYPIDTEHHIRAAWTFIHRPHNAARYTSAQLEHIKQRIAAAWRATIELDGPPAVAGPRATRNTTEVAQRASEVIDGLDRLDEYIAAASSLPGTAQQRRLHAMIGELRGHILSPGLADGAQHQPPSADLAPLVAWLAKLAGDIMPRLDALQKRVDEIARTPMPAQTVVRGHGLAGISKRQDAGGGVDTAEDVVAALAGMSEEERTLTLIKAAHANPLRRPR